MKNLKFLIMFLSLVVGTSTFAQKMLVVEMRDGSNASFSLPEMPRISFAGEQMSIISSTTSMDFVRSNVRSYHFVDSSTSVNEVTALSQATIESNTLVISGVTPGTAITLYSANGMVVEQAVATDGSCAISLNELPTGVYIVAYNNTTFKFLKK